MLDNLTRGNYVSTRVGEVIRLSSRLVTITVRFTNMTTTQMVLVLLKDDMATFGMMLGHC